MWHPSCHDARAGKSGMIYCFPGGSPKILRELEGSGIVVTTDAVSLSR
jgi:hypothetical protein